MRHSMSVLLKPTSSRCNLDCTYCFYLSKQSIYPWSDRPSMSLDTFETFLRQYVPMSAPHLSFLWQGGEPTMMGLPFFEAAVEREIAVTRELISGPMPPVNNAIQTNATLLDEDWARFFKERRFLVGVSIDGPPEWHDRFRIDPVGRPSHDNVMRGVEHLKRERVPFNVLSVISQSNVDKPRELLRWLVDQGFHDLQFIPCAEPAEGCASVAEGGITPESITPTEYGKFLNELFDEWIEIGVDKVRIRWFDNLIQMLWGYPSEMCELAENCGYIVMEHNGDCYPCDFRVEEDWLLGNVHDTPLDQIVEGEMFTRFNQVKSKLHADCQRCRWKTLCYGECPSYRIVSTGNAEHELPYFCGSFIDFFSESYDRMEALAVRLGNVRGLAVPREQMSPALRTSVPARPVRAQPDRRAPAAKRPKIGRNDPCPCGSGKKVKRCCGDRVLL